MHEHFLQRIFNATEQMSPPLPARLLEEFPLLRRVTARMVGMVSVQSMCSRRKHSGSPFAAILRMKLQNRRRRKNSAFDLKASISVQIALGDTTVGK